MYVGPRQLVCWRESTSGWRSEMGVLISASGQAYSGLSGKSFKPSGLIPLSVKCENDIPSSQQLATSSYSNKAIERVMWD